MADSSQSSGTLSILAHRPEYGDVPGWAVPTVDPRKVVWLCSACGRRVAITGPFTISCPDHPRAAVRR